jgi:hypothetical protein
MQAKKFDGVKLQARLQELVTYDEATGIFTAKKSVGNVAAGSVRGNKDAVGYLRFSVDGVQRLSHVLAWVYVYGKQPDGCIDHINGIKDDNRIANLRDVTASQNSHNVPITATTGVSQKRKLFRAKLTIDGKRQHIGYYRTREEAHSAYLKEKNKLFSDAPMRFKARAALVKATGETK